MSVWEANTDMGYVRPTYRQCLEKRTEEGHRRQQHAGAVTKHPAARGEQVNLLHSTTATHVR